MKGHGNGAEDVGQESSKNREQEIKGPAVARDFSGGEGNIPQPARAFCLTSHSQLLTERQGVGGW